MTVQPTRLPERALLAHSRNLRSKRQSPRNMPATKSKKKRGRFIGPAFCLIQFSELQVCISGRMTGGA
jgi:hypothetical protein